MRPYLMSVTMLCAGSISASALVQSEVASYGSVVSPFAIASDFPLGLTFQKFDLSLGTLDSIVVTLSSTYNVQASIANIGGSSAFQNAQASATITLTDLEGMTTETTLATVPFSSLIGDGSPANPAFLSGPAVQNTVVGSLLVDPAQFGLYEWNGIGGNSYTLNAAALGTSSGTGNPSLFFSCLASSYGTVKIDYTYTVVPEPGCIGLCLLGLCGIGMARRIRSR